MTAVEEAIKSYFADWYDKQLGRVGCLYMLVLSGTCVCVLLNVDHCSGSFSRYTQLEWFLFHSLVKVCMARKK